MVPTKCTTSHCLANDWKLFVPWYFNELFSLFEMANYIFYMACIISLIFFFDLLHIPLIITYFKLARADMKVRKRIESW